MRSLTPRPLSPLRHFSSTPSPLRNSEESKAVKITVWWDIEDCSIPTGVIPYGVVHQITSALRYHGIKGPLTITAFGNMLELNEATRDALCTTGVGFNHVPNCGKKNSTDSSILADLVYWVAQNPPPAHFFLISGDKVFASTLRLLRISNYNILLASGSSNGSTALYSAATIMWNWDALVRGDSLTGRHFNHPPDGLYGSCYGHCEASITLDDVVDDVEKQLTGPEEHAMLANAACKWCSKSFISESALQTHTKALHAAWEWCSKSFISESALQTHTKALHAAWEWCSKSFFSKSALQNHTKALHAAWEWCSKSFFSESAWQIYTKALHAAWEWCSKSFFSKSALQNHTKALHG